MGSITSTRYIVLIDGTPTSFLFCDASGLAVNVKKSDFVYSCDDMEIRNQTASLLPYKMTGLEGVFKYLGFFLKPNGYKKR